MKTKTKTKEHVDELEAYKGKWTNLWFRRDGKSASSGFLYTSEQEAFDALSENIQRLRAKAESHPSADVRLIQLSEKIGEDFLLSQVSHVIQMPVGE